MKINQQLSVLFLLEKSRPTKEGLLPITVRITVEDSWAEFMLGIALPLNFGTKRPTA